MLGSEFGDCSRPTGWRASETTGRWLRPGAKTCPVPGSWPWLVCPADEADLLDLRLSPLGRKWHWMWVFLWPDVLKRNSQKGHLKGLEPVWRRMWTFKLPFVEKDVLHMWQLNSFWPTEKIRASDICLSPVSSSDVIIFKQQKAAQNTQQLKLTKGKCLVSFTLNVRLIKQKSRRYRQLMRLTLINLKWNGDGD